MSSLADIFRYSSQVPNWAPNERFLPNADYGRVGALKLANNLFITNVADYVDANVGNAIHRAWAEAGAYHYYLLGKHDNKEANEGIRAGLDAAPNYLTFKYGTYNRDRERDGPYAVQEVLMEITEAARTYSFSPQVLVGAVLTLIRNRMLKINTYARNALMPAECQTGHLMARYNFGLLEALWGMRHSGYPKTMAGSGLVAARGDYGKGSKKRGKKRRRRY